MICINSVNKYCSDDITLIENYDKAMDDLTQIWDCHHRLETELKLSQKELKEKDLYFNRPASELIFLTHSEHTILHNKNYVGKKHYSGKKRKMPIEEKIRRSKILKDYYANHESCHKNNKWMTDGLTEYFVIPEYWGELIDIGFHFGKKNKPHNTGKHLSEDTKKKQSATFTGAKLMNNGIERRYVLKDQIEYYLNLGYVFGKKLKT